MAKKTAKPAEKAPAEKPTTLSQVKAAVATAADKVAEVATDVAHAAEKHVVTPVGRAVGLVKKPKPKPTRAKTPVAKPPAPLPARSKTLAGKVMSKNLAPVPKGASGASVAKAKGKPKA